jgi:hypothetical protein
MRWGVPEVREVGERLSSTFDAHIKDVVPSPFLSLSVAPSLSVP